MRNKLKYNSHGSFSLNLSLSKKKCNNDCFVTLEVLISVFCFVLFVFVIIINIDAHFH